MRSKRILLVEDNAEIQIFVSRVLALEGAELTLAGSALLAGTAMDQERGFDLVILDLTLPDGSGWALLDSLRALGVGSEIPLLIFTSSDDRKTLERAAECGANDVIVKPIGARELVDRISAIWA